VGDIECYPAENSESNVIGYDLVSISISVMMCNIIRWYKPLRSQELVNMSPFASIPVTGKLKPS